MIPLVILWMFCGRLVIVVDAAEPQRCVVSAGHCGVSAGVLRQGGGLC